MKFAKGFVVLLLARVACAEESSLTSAAKVIRAEGGDVPTPGDTKVDGWDHGNDNEAEDDGSDAAVDDVQVNYNHVTHHVRVMDGQPPPPDVTHNQPISVHVTTRFAEHDSGATTAGIVQDNALDHSRASVDVLPDDGRELASIVDGQPTLIDATNSQPALADHDSDAANAGGDEDNTLTHSRDSVDVLVDDQEMARTAPVPLSNASAQEMAAAPDTPSTFEIGEFEGKAGGAEQAAGVDEAVDDVHVEYNTVSQHVRFVGSQPPIAHADADEDEALLYSKAPVEPLPHVSQGLARTASVSLPRPVVPAATPEAAPDVDVEDVEEPEAPWTVGLGQAKEPVRSASDHLPHPEAPDALWKAELVDADDAEMLKATEPLAMSTSQPEQFAIAAYPPVPRTPSPMPETSEAPKFPLNEALRGVGASESDSYAMMMYLKGRAASLAKENQHMKDALAQASACSKGVSQTVAELGTERKETATLQGQLRGYQATKDEVLRQLKTARERERVAEGKAKSLAYLHRQLLGAQRDNADLRNQLDNATRVDANLRVRLAASKDGVWAAKRSQSALAARTKSEEEWLEEEAKRLDDVEVVRKEADATLEDSDGSRDAAGKLQQVVDQRDKLLRKGSQQLAAEKEKEQQLVRSELDAQEANFTDELKYERGNSTSRLRQLLASRAKVREMQRAASIAWREMKSAERPVPERLRQLGGAEPVPDTRAEPRGAARAELEAGPLLRPSLQGRRAPRLREAAESWTPADLQPP